MSDHVSTVFWLVFVGMVWGCTTPLMKAGSVDYEAAGAGGLLAKIRFVLTHPRFTLPLLVNLSGSTIFYWALGQTKLSLVVPITKSLEFVFVALTSWLLGEVQLAPSFYLGMILVCLGVGLMTS
jgi:drug/metabolite transporter (DMT)-like permease